MRSSLIGVFNVTVKKSCQLYPGVCWRSNVFSVHCGLSRAQKGIGAVLGAFTVRV